MTERQKEFIDFIASFKEACGYPPTIREIVSGLGLASTSTVKKMLDRLAKKGFIEKNPSKARGLDVLLNNNIPLLGTIKAGTPVLSEENIEQYISLKNLLRGENIFFLRVSGNSMSEKGILDGDYLLIKQLSMLDNNEIGVFRINGEVTVKTFYKDDLKKEIILVPANKDYKTIQILENDNFEIIGKVIMVLRHLEGSL
jgi:repressor LexA